MNNRTNNIINEIKDLPTEELYRIKVALDEMLYQPDPEIEQAWIAESRCRLEEMKKGEVETSTWDEVNAELKKITGEST